MALRAPRVHEVGAGAAVPGTDVADSDIAGTTDTSDDDAFQVAFSRASVTTFSAIGTGAGCNSLPGTAALDAFGVIVAAGEDVASPDEPVVCTRAPDVSTFDNAVSNALADASASESACDMVPRSSSDIAVLIARAPKVNGCGPNGTSMAASVDANLT